MFCQTLRITLFALFSVLGVFCQGQVPVSERNSRVDLHITADYIGAGSLGTYVSGGLLGEFHYGDRVSAFFPLAFGKDYFEIGLGTIFAPLGLWAMSGGEEKTLGEFFGMLLAVATSVESMGYHIRLGEKQEFIPYYSLCRLRSFDSQGELSASLGLMMRLHLSDRWHLNWSGEYSQFYTLRQASGVEGGMSVAYVFR
ncbi:hypothetical protein [Marinoscillum sp.]|uniref:hypothetical protein n=1 Tax=Marinoscillum sp. TaxID=2024838 RepID=UPI003BAD3234